MSNHQDSTDGNRPGAHSLQEIVSQPACWGSCLEQLPAIIRSERIIESFAGAREWLFVGCGSSFYLALAAAASWNKISGLRARAVPASEVLLYPDLTLSAAKEMAAVVISRSGRTSEAVRAAEQLQRDRRIPTLGITCAPATPLQQVTSRTLVLSAADESSTVMTRSFTSMLLGLQYLAARIANDMTMIQALEGLPAMAEAVLPGLHQRIKDFSEHRFADHICLGQGPFFGLACECALKLTEMSVSYAQSYHTLEFRHGPKSVVGPETLILFLVSEHGYDSEREVLQEMKALGGTTLTLVNRADDRLRAASDLLFEFGFDLPEVAQLAAFVFAGQLMGLYTGLKKGLDPDHPRNLSRVVILNESSSESPDHAAL